MDHPSSGLWLVLIALFALGSGYFSLMETALMESRRGTLEKLAEDENRDAQEALAILEHPERYLSVAQIGITLTGILCGMFAGMFVAPYVAALFAPIREAAWIALFLTVIGVTYGMLLLGEFLPKRIAAQRPEHILMEHYHSLKRLTLLARPIVSLLSASANSLLLLLGINPKIEDTVTEDEVKDLIEQGTEDGTFEKAEQYMVDRIFHLSDQTAYGLMTPRTQMLWLDLSDPLKENLKLIRENPLTVFAVGRDSLDDFCGVLYAKDLLNASLDRKSLDLMQYLRKPMFIPRSMETFRLLEKFRDSGIHEAVVLDEYGGVIGFITLDDILQEIIGDSATNIEPDLIQVTQRDENSWYVDGLYSIDDFKERFGVDELPDEEHDHYQTMGGFLTSYFGYIPKVAECCEWNGFRFEIVDMDRARIDKILITKLENQEEDLTAENA